MFFVFNYNSENTVIRNLALLSLAIATGLKLYPVFFGLLLLNKKHKEDAVKAIVYDVALFYPSICRYGWDSEHCQNASKYY